MKILSVISLVMLPAWVMASPGAYYFGGAVAQVDGEGITAGLEDTSNASLEDTRSGKTIFVGHRFLSGSALEISYVDLGAVSDEYAVSNASPESLQQLNKELRPMAAEGASLSYVTNLPVEQLFEINMSVGVMHWRAEYDYLADGVNQEVKDSGTDITYGLGATRDLGQNCIGRVGWTRFQLDGEVVNVGSIGMAYAF